LGEDENAGDIDVGAFAGNPADSTPAATPGGAAAANGYALPNSISPQSEAGSQYAAGGLPGSSTGMAGNQFGRPGSTGPAAPGAPGMPDAPDMPDAPGMPNAPGTPGAPGVPGVPESYARGSAGSPPSGYQSPAAGPAMPTPSPSPAVPPGVGTPPAAGGTPGYGNFAGGTPSAAGAAAPQSSGAGGMNGYTTPPSGLPADPPSGYATPTRTGNSNVAANGYGMPGTESPAKPTTPNASAGNAPRVAQTPSTNSSGSSGYSLPEMTTPRPAAPPAAAQSNPYAVPGAQGDSTQMAGGRSTDTPPAAAPTTGGYRPGSTAGASSYPTTPYTPPTGSMYR
jgi:hypothetical protein